MDDFLELLILFVALISAAMLLRAIAKYRWLLVLTVLMWGAFGRMFSRKAGDDGLLIFGVLTALLVVTVLILPWVSRLRIVLVVKGAFILLWRKARGLADVAENVARTGAKKE